MEARCHACPTRTVALPVQRVYLWVRVQVRHPLNIHTQRRPLRKAVRKMTESLRGVPYRLLVQTAALPR